MKHSCVCTHMVICDHGVAGVNDRRESIFPGVNLSFKVCMTFLQQFDTSDVMFRDLWHLYHL